MCRAFGERAGIPFLRCGLTARSSVQIDRVASPYPGLTILPQFPLSQNIDQLADSFGH